MGFAFGIPEPLDRHLAFVISHEHNRHKDKIAAVNSGPS